MNLHSQILQALDENTKKSIGKKAGIGTDSVDKIVRIGVPLMLGNLGHNASTKKGASQLLGALEKKHNGSLLDNINDIFSDGDQSNDGLKILGHIFGEKSQSTEEKIADQSGVDLETTIKVLSFIAPIVLAQLGKNKLKSNLDVNNLPKLLKQQSTGKGNSFMDIASTFLDKNKDGSMIDDIFDMFT